MDRRAFLRSSALGLGGLLPAADEDYVTDTMSCRCHATTQRLRAIAASGNAARVCLAARDDSGRWVAAVDLNAGGRSCFVPGRWKPGCGLGTHGFDPETRTVWAVLNRDG